MMKPLDSEKIDTIVIHITVSDYGDVATIDQWHKARKWDMIGYHYLITNCFPTRYRWEAKKPDLNSDGRLHKGRPIEFQGAHVRGHNDHTIGMAIVGKKGAFTSRQLETAARFCRELKVEYPTITNIVGHFELFEGKSCPDLDMDHFREVVAAEE